MKTVKRLRITLFLILICLCFVGEAVAQDWKSVAQNIIADYRGKVVRIEQLNGSTCWAELSPNIPIEKIPETAENIGYYIRNATGGIRGEKPSVHVFVSGKHVAVARPSGLNYRAKFQFQDWGPAAFKGKYRP